MAFVKNALTNNQNEERLEFIERVKEKGFRVVFPRPNQILIDIDTEGQYTVFKENFEMLKRNLNGVLDVDELIISQNKPSTSGLPRRHIYVQFPIKLNELERITIQAFLGSDPKRELLSYIRYLKGDEYPTLLIEKKED